MAASVIFHFQVQEKRANFCVSVCQSPISLVLALFNAVCFEPVLDDIDAVFLGFARVSGHAPNALEMPPRFARAGVLRPGSVCRRISQQITLRTCLHRF